MPHFSAVGTLQDRNSRPCFKTIHFDQAWEDWRVQRDHQQRSWGLSDFTKAPDYPWKSAHSELSLLIPGQRMPLLRTWSKMQVLTIETGIFQCPLGTVIELEECGGYFTLFDLNAQKGALEEQKIRRLGDHHQWQVKIINRLRGSEEFGLHLLYEQFQPTAFHDSLLQILNNKCRWCNCWQHRAWRQRALPGTKNVHEPWIQWEKILQSKTLLQFFQRLWRKPNKCDLTDGYWRVFQHSFW